MNTIELALGIGLGLFLNHVLTIYFNQFRAKLMSNKLKTLTAQYQGLGTVGGGLDTQMKYEKTPVKKPKVTKKAVAKKGKK